MNFGVDVEDRRDRRYRVEDVPPGRIIQVAGIEDAVFLVVWNKTGRALVNLADGFTIPEKDHANRRARVLNATLVLND